VLQPPLDYETPQRRGTRAIYFWLAFAVSAVVGLLPANMVDELFYHARTGHYPDGGATIVSVAGVPLAAIVAWFVGRRSRGSTWKLAVAAVCGVVACPITVAFLYAIS